MPLCLDYGGINLGAYYHLAGSQNRIEISTQVFVDEAVADGDLLPNKLQLCDE